MGGVSQDLDLLPGEAREHESDERPPEFGPRGALGSRPARSVEAQEHRQADRAAHERQRHDEPQDDPAIPEAHLALAGGCRVVVEEAAEDLAVGAAKERVVERQAKGLPGRAKKSCTRE